MADNRSPRWPWGKELSSGATYWNDIWTKNGGRA